MDEKDNTPDPIESRLSELRESQKANDTRRETLRRELNDAEIKAHQFAAVIGELVELQKGLKTKGSDS